MIHKVLHPGSMKPIILFVLNVFLLVSACQKEVLTEGEKTAKTVQAVIQDNSITKANLYVGNARQQYDVPFSIEGGFLVFRNASPNEYYNLAKLIRFDIAPNVANGPKVIQFYF